jgi:hypothetical protein
MFLRITFIALLFSSQVWSTYIDNEMDPFEEGFSSSFSTANEDHVALLTKEGLNVLAFFFPSRWKLFSCCNSPDGGAVEETAVVPTTELPIGGVLTSSLWQNSLLQLLTLSLRQNCL